MNCQNCGSDKFDCRVEVTVRKIAYVVIDEEGNREITHVERDASFFPETPNVDDETLYCSSCGEQFSEE